MTKNNYFQEDIYLQGKRSALEAIQKEREEVEERITTEQETKQAAMSLYDSFVEEAACFVKQLGLETSIERSLVISYLIEEGYLSYAKEFKKQVTSSELSSRLGISIIFGKGCCRNITSIHQDIMGHLQMPVKRLYCNYDNIFHKGTRTKADHVISVIRFRKVHYGMDLYNGDKLYRFKTPHELREISSTQSQRLFYKPYAEIIVEGATLQEIRKNVKRFQRDCEKKPITPLYYEEEVKFPVEQHMMNHKDACEDFHEKTKRLKKDIYWAFYDRRNDYL